MRHLTLLHVPTMGVDVIFIVKAICVFGLSSLREVGRSKYFFLRGAGLIRFGGECNFFKILISSVAQLSSAFNSLSCFLALL